MFPSGRTGCIDNRFQCVRNGLKCTVNRDAIATGISNCTKFSQGDGLHPWEATTNRVGFDIRYPWPEVVEIAPSGARDEFSRKLVGVSHRIQYTQKDVYRTEEHCGTKKRRRKDIKESKALAQNSLGEHKKMESDSKFQTKTMNVKISQWDVADYLETPEDIAHYLEAVFEDGDSSLIAAAIGDVARSKGMTSIAAETGLGRESLYKALSMDGNPGFANVLSVLKALGLRLCPVVATVEANQSRKLSGSGNLGYGASGTMRGSSVSKTSEFTAGSGRWQRTDKIASRGNVVSGTAKPLRNTRDRKSTKSASG